ncbi:MAG: DUF3990 domain-containing protein [Clostridia bacterium]|nr:DUF3990 domain-containing protein [Clostridia bacterium]
MTLFHGSTVLVDHPEIRTGDVYLDFGVGFYTTTSYLTFTQAKEIK